MPWFSDVPAASQEEIARQATKFARAALPQTDVELFWDETWGWRLGDVRIPDPELLSRGEPDWAKRAATVSKCLRDADDYWFHVYKPSSGDVIVDIGAGRGEDVYAFAQRAGQVWAIEPHPVSYLALRKLCEWNSLKNVSTHQYACVDRAQSLQIETLPVWESNYVRVGAPNANSFPVKGVTFDELSRRLGIGHIDFLKMNIEGAERFALPGCDEALRRTKSVCVAAHDFRAERGEGEEFRTLAFVKAFLRERGFQLTTRDEDRRYYVPYHVHGVRER